MELLVPALTLPAAGAPASPPPRRSLRLAVVTSVAVHGALVISALLLPAYVPAGDAPPVTVDIITEVVVPPAEPEAVPPPAPVKPAVIRRAAPMPAAPTRPLPAAVTPTPAEEPTSQDAPVVDEVPQRTVGDGPSVLVATIPTGPPSGAAAGVAAGGAPPLTEAQRSSMIGRYRELLRSRIRDGFRYPPEARELELEGQVLVQVTVDKAGRLRGARLSGACPHPVLCDDALRTVRASAPFPALPADLGDSLRIEIPLKYDFQ
jgi:periplasmic protein TonB